MEKFTDLLMTVVAVSIVIFALLLPKLTPQRGPLGTYGGTVVSGSRVPVETRDGYEKIFISTGNASFTYQPGREYITLMNGGSSDLNITGWKLMNSKGNRLYPGGSSGVHYASDVVVVPRGVSLYNPEKPNYLEDIILKPGETAVLITGSPVPNSLPSFKENACTGYLKESHELPYLLAQNCPFPGREPGIASLENDCRDFVERLSSCRDPKLTYNNEEGLSTICRAYVESHFTYAGCIGNHASDSNFPGRVWYVYLHRPWEMWAEKYETISLYDRTNTLRGSKSY